MKIVFWGMKRMIPQIEYKLITPSIGAEITRFDCTSVTSEIAIELRKLLILRKALVFRDQAITPSEFLKFMKNFGNPYAEDIKPQDGNPPEIGVIKIQPAERQTINFWHMDYSFQEKPAPILALHAKQVPPCGGDTLFANLEAAYDGLEERIKIQISSLLANHKLSVQTQNAKNRWTKKELEEMDANPPIQHPLVCINPDNEKKFLFINVPIFCGSIVGMEVEKSSDLLSSLYRHVQQPEFNFRLVWSEDTLVVWENTHCLHYPVSDYFPHERKMLRVAIQGHRKPCSVC